MKVWMQCVSVRRLGCMRGDNFTTVWPSSFVETNAQSVSRFSLLPYVICGLHCRYKNREQFEENAKQKHQRDINMHLYANIICKYVWCVLRVNFSYLFGLRCLRLFVKRWLYGGGALSQTREVDNVAARVL